MSERERVRGKMEGEEVGCWDLVDADGDGADGGGECGEGEAVGGARWRG